MGTGFSTGRAPLVNADGSFVVDNLSKGWFTVSAVVRDQGVRYRVESIRIDTTETPGGTFSIDERPSLPIEVRFELGTYGSVEGFVVDRNNRPLRNARVYMVPVSPGAPPGLDLSFLSSFTTTDDRGHFGMPQLRPGEYQAFAWERVPENAYLNAEFMREFRRVAAATGHTSGGSTTRYRSAQ